MSSINALDAQSKAQLQAYIQKAVRDGLVATEQRRVPSALRVTTRQGGQVGGRGPRQDRATPDDS
ncbi:hypothetical protein E4U27_004737, partial [Claviceps purpurea]